MHINEISFEIATAASSQKVAISGASAQSAAFSAPSGWSKGAAIKVLVSPDVDCFALRGSNPTALADGTHQILRGGNHYRVQVMDSEKLAFITSGATGNVYLTQDA